MDVAATKEFNALDYEGKVIDNVYTFKTLYCNKCNNIATWNIYVKLIARPNQKYTKSFDAVRLRNSYFIGNHKLAPEYVAIVWTEYARSGDGKLTRTRPTTINAPSNKGKKNERNVLQRAIIYASRKYKNKIKEGYKENRGASTPSTSTRYYPMLLTNFTEKHCHIKYPCYVQPKSDGVRALSYMAEGGGINIYTRKLKDHSKNYAGIKTLECIFEHNNSIYLDCEIYHLDTKLQDITAHIQTISKEIDNNLEFWIFDCFVPGENKSFGARWQDLQKLFNGCGAAKNIRTLHFNCNKILAEFNKIIQLSKTKPNVFKKQAYGSIQEMIDVYAEMAKLGDHSIKIMAINGVVLMPTITVHNRAELEYYYRGLLIEGFEGAVARNIDGKYLTSNESTSAKLRSKDVQKIKPIYTAEYKIVGVVDTGKARDRSCPSSEENLIWLLVTPEGKEFKASIKDATEEQTKKIYADIKNKPGYFEDKYKNKYVTVTYLSKTRDGKPMHAKASLVTRD